MNNYALTDETDDWEWADEPGNDQTASDGNYDRMVIIGNGGITNLNANRAGTVSYAYRCFIPLRASTSVSGNVSSAFSVHKNGINQNLLTDTWTKVTWSAAEFDVNNDFNLTNGSFFAPVSGKYFLSASAGVYLNDNDYTRLYIRKNGAPYKQSTTFMMGGTGWANVVATAVVNASAGDYFDVIAKHSYGSNQNISGATSYTHFSGYLLESHGLWELNGSDVYYDSGNVGIGTSSPGYDLSVGGTVGGATGTVVGIKDDSYAQIMMGADDNNWANIYWENSSGSYKFYTKTDGAGANVLTMKNSNVGIGITNPTTGKLEISNPETAGGIDAIRVYNDETGGWGLVLIGDSTYGIYLGTNADDTCQDSSGNGACNLNDYAEMMEFSEMPEDGDLIIIDTENPGLLKISDKPYDSLVAGIASENPAMVIGSYGITIKGWEEANREDGTITYPLAISGRKRIKVTDENGKIQPGDLLVTSSEPGKAMRCDVYEKCQGAILGKAMTSVGEDGKVLTLITLQ
jgi:hypothetical protein